MDNSELEETVRVFELSLSAIKWRLKFSSKCRLQTDILALCTGMRPVIMVDYGGKMPELGERLVAFLKCCKNESNLFEFLKVMVIDDMVYLINVTALAEFVNSSLNGIMFLDLETDPLKIVTTQAEKKPAALTHLLSAQKLFSTVFPAQVQDQSSELVDLSFCLQTTQVTIPSLNGWLLGYPVVYLFGVDCIERAISNLSTKSLHVYQVYVNRVGTSGKGNAREELTSFTVPYELSVEGSDEPWAKSFLAHMQERWSKCKQVWGSLHMEVCSCSPQSIAL